MKTTDRNYGVQDMGGTPSATFICPIFDTRPQGSFYLTDAIRRSFSPNPPKPPVHDPYERDNYVTVLNPFSIKQYSVAEQFGFDLRDFEGMNWLRLLEFSRQRVDTGSLSRFINAITAPVRLEHSPEKSKSAREFFIKVTSRAFGQIIPNESLGSYVPPMVRSDKNITLLRESYRIGKALAPSFNSRTQ